VLVASGATYRRLNVPRWEEFEGAGIYFSATTTEVPLCKDQDVLVIGGGNSAGQAAVFLAGAARHVYLVCRGTDLAATMSRYLVHRLRELPSVEILMRTQVTALLGEATLAGVRLRHESGAERDIAVAAVFCMIGAIPRSDWLPADVLKDRKGFVLTGADADRGSAAPLRRPRYLLETTVPGVFAAGDVRASSSKRVAAAVGEGAMAVQFVHQYLEGA
jgi:thioredoxin reductase (NADPH)